MGGNEGNESYGCHEGNEGNEGHEEDRPCVEQARQGRQQEELPPWQAVTLDCSSSEGPQGTQDQGLLSYQEGHSTLRKGQGVLQPVSGNNMRNLLQTWGFLRLSSAGASFLESFGINDEGCI